MTDGALSRLDEFDMTDHRATDEFLSETLFHFLGHGDDDRLLGVFDSIVRRGFLLTVGNKQGKLDQFHVSLQNGKTETLELMQRAKVCFTDIPERHLSSHSQEYGRFGVGFARKTIIDWGGSDVVYLPNHAAPDTLATTMGSVLYLQHRIPLLLAALEACLAPADAPLTINETTLRGEARKSYIDQARHGLLHLWSFVKEMSGKEDDYRYLYEREWRIVEGGVHNGKETSRALTNDEARELAATCPRWNEPIEMSPENAARYPHKHAHQFFQWFNGLPELTVAQGITVILVPSESVLARVREYIDMNPGRFGSAKPDVRLFGHAE